MIYLPFIPVTIGALLETFGIHGALTLGMVVSLVVIAIGLIVMAWQMAGPLEALGMIAFASIFALGINAANTHDASPNPKHDAPSAQAGHDRRR